MSNSKIDAFIASKRNRDNILLATAERYAAELEEFSKFLSRQDPIRTLVAANTDDINLFLSYRGADNSPSQKRWTLAPIRGYFKYLQEERIRLDNPTTGVLLPKLARRRDDRSILSRDDVTKLLGAPHGRLALRDKAIIRLFYSGLKRGEVNALLGRDVNLNRREVKIDGRPVPVSQETADAIEAYLKAHPIAKGQPLFLGRAKGPMGYRQLWQIVKKYADACGLDENINPETLRATFAVHAIEAGISYVELIDALGTYNDDWLRDLTQLARDEMKKNVSSRTDRAFAPRISIEVLPKSLLPSTRKAWIQLCDEANGCYSIGYYDAAAILFRRIIEALLIELYVSAGRENEIKTGSSFFMLDALITYFEKDTSWMRRSRNLVPDLKAIKTVGDMAAHHRFHITHRMDIDNVGVPLRRCVSELVNLAGLG